MSSPSRWWDALFLAALVGVGCRNDDAPREAPSAQPAVSVGRAPQPFVPEKVDVVERAMGTEIHFIAYTTRKSNAATVRKAIAEAMKEVARLEKLMSSWRDDSEVSAIGRQAGSVVPVSTDTFLVIEKGLWAGSISEGAFDISFNVLHDVWKFGDAAEQPPRVPDAKLVARRRRLIDYRKVVLDQEARSVKIAPGMSIGLGGIAKGYTVDRAAMILRMSGVPSFLAQAGGDLYGAGRKPDGSKWVSGIQDPRGPEGQFFATIDLEDHAFSTAGDYARSYIVDGKRYHHIIDPRTGYPATASRSVTVWAPDAFTADAIDDVVFILGPKKGLEIVERLPGVGAVIVDTKNKVWVSKRLEGKVRLSRAPTDGI